MQSKSQWLFLSHINIFFKKVENDSVRELETALFSGLLLSGRGIYEEA